MSAISEVSEGEHMKRTSSSVGNLAMGAVILICVLVSVPAQASPTAQSARTISLNESGSLHLTSKRGFTLNEEGSATGTIRGKIYLHLTVASTNRVTAEVSIYPRGGSLTGKAAASYHVAGATASFSGTMSIARGTGSYRHARGVGLGFNGTISRSNDAVRVHLTGKLSV
jgi:hypothetical protein